MIEALDLGVLADVGGVLLQTDIEACIDDSFFDCLIGAYTDSSFVDEATLATFVWVTLAIGLYIFGDGVILPLVFTLIYGGLTIPYIVSPLANRAEVIALFAVVGIIAAAYWRLSRS